MPAYLPLKYVSLLVLTLQNSALTILLHYSRTSPSAKPYSAPAAVLLNELLKGGISFLIALRNSFSTPITSDRPQLHSSAFTANGKAPVSKSVEYKGADATKEWRPAEIFHGRSVWYFSLSGWREELAPRARIILQHIFDRDCWKLSIPAILYVIQNNLQFVAASNLDVATFQVTYQLKILTTALCSVVMLGRRLTLTKWLSLFLLAVGVAIIQVENISSTGSTSSSHPTGDPFTGFVAILAACFTSGLAGVYFELVLKGSDVDVWTRNIQLSLFSLLPALGTAFLPKMSFTGASAHPRALEPRAALFANFGTWAWATVLCQVLGGLVTALVIKFADNILKGFATSLSIVVSFAASIVLFDSQLSAQFAFGCLTVLGATYMYNRPHRPALTRQGSAGRLLRGIGLGKPAGSDGRGSPLPVVHKMPMPPTQTFDYDDLPNTPPGSRRPHRFGTPDASKFNAEFVFDSSYSGGPRPESSSLQHPTAHTP